MKHIFIHFLFAYSSLAITSCTPKSQDVTPQSTCTSLLCRSAKYSLFIANLDGTNVEILKTSSYQDMTHPRVSNDKNWVTYTTYHDLNSEKCATFDQGYLNTEIRAIKISSLADKSIVSNVSGQLNSNNYWIGNTNEMTYLSGPPTNLKFFRLSLSSNLDSLAAPTQISVPSTIIPMDPVTNLGSNKIVYAGLYDSGGGSYVKSIFMMNLSDSSNVVGLSLGRNHAGGTIACDSAECLNIMENDPKISPDGTKVAFMRRALISGANGFGWHIFVVPVASPLNEVNISYSALGSDTSKNDALPEWIDNNKLIFSTIEITSSTNVSKNVYTMNANGSNRTKISLPEGFRYADVFPFTDSQGNSKIILSAEKIAATCSQ